jgi:hypothetical protein
MGNERTYRDEVGQRFDRLAEAEAHAAVIARELAMDGDIYSGYVVCIIDDRDNEAARVPIGKDVS